MPSLEKKIGTAVLKLIRTHRQASAEPQAQAFGPVPPAKLRPAQFSDFPAVAELKRRGGLNADSPENWNRLWQHNPALAMSPVERPIGWVLEADGAIVGYLGNISLVYQHAGRTLTAVTAHGLVVDPPYRAMGVTLVAAFFRQKSVDLFISTSAIEAVGKIALAFKSSPIPQPDYDTALFWVLRPYAFSRALAQKLGIAASLSRFAGVLIAAAIIAEGLLRGRSPRKSSAALAIRELGLSDASEDLEALWKQKQAEEGLFADRSPATLRWHFEIPGDRGSARMLGCYKAGQMIGYAVVRNDVKNGLRTSIIADMIARDDDREVVEALWSAAYDYAKQAESDILEVLGFPPAVRGVGLNWNPYRRQYPACPFYFKAADAGLHKTLADGAAWYASPYDGDATLIRPSYPDSGPSRNSRPRAQEFSNTIITNTLQHETPEVY